MRIQPQAHLHSKAIHNAIHNKKIGKFVAFIVNKMWQAVPEKRQFRIEQKIRVFHVVAENAMEFEPNQYLIQFKRYSDLKLQLLIQFQFANTIPM